MSGGSKKSSGRRLAAPAGAGPGAPGSTAGSEGGNAPTGSPCDLSYDVELTGVRADVVAVVRIGDVLDVALHRAGAFETAVCRTRPAGRVVGTLANVEGLDELLGCLRTHHRYAATVTQVGRLLCRVAIAPVLG